MAMAVFLGLFGMVVGIAISFEAGYGKYYADLENDSNNITSYINQFNIYNSVNQQMVNSSQYAPGGINSQIPDDTQSQSGSLSKSSFQLALEFGGQAMTLPKKILNLVGGYLGIPYELISMASLFFFLTVVFILASAVFFNKL
jgi:hypothetical protein